MGWRSWVFLHAIERGQRGCLRHMRRYRTNREAWRRWRRNAKRRGKRIQHARGKRYTTVSAVVVHFRESFMAVGAVNIDGHTHFSKRHVTHSCGTALHINAVS